MMMMMGLEKNHLLLYNNNYKIWIIFRYNTNYYYYYYGENITIIIRLYFSVARVNGVTVLWL